MCLLRVRVLGSIQNVVFLRAKVGQIGIILHEFGFCLLQGWFCNMECQEDNGVEALQMVVTRTSHSYAHFCLYHSPLSFELKTVGSSFVPLIGSCLIFNGFG